MIALMSDIRQDRSDALAVARSFLFVPGSDAHKVERALAVGADAVVIDLEDAVLPSHKDRARAQLIGALTSANTASLRLVRVNAVGTPWFDADLTVLASDVDAIDAVVLPKASCAAVERAAELGAPVVALVETAEGLRTVHAVASAAGVSALVLGAVDLRLELGLDPRADGLEILFARFSLVVASALAGTRAPIDQVWVDTRDLAGLRSECSLARSLGFRGKICIHPDQVAVVNEAFTPSPEEIAWAERVVSAHQHAADEGLGAFALDGRMVDLPVLERARRLLSTSRSFQHAA
jgi:citrate lyase subunit beta / citryl-CoA lyase